VLYRSRPFARRFPPPWTIEEANAIADGFANPLTPRSGPLGRQYFINHGKIGIVDRPGGVKSDHVD